MESYQITQKILSIGATYEVRPTGQDAVLMTVKGKVLAATPQLTIMQGAGGPPIGEITGNFFKTRFRIVDAGGVEQGTLAFPFIMFKKSFTLTVGGVEYKASGGFTGWSFRCTDPQGQTVFEIGKEVAIRDKFTVTVSEAIPRIVAFLAAVAIDQRLFQGG